MLAHVGTEWDILAHVGIQFSPHFIHWDNSFSGSIWFYQDLSFENSPRAGLGRILAVACATTEKHWCPQRHASVGKLS